MHTNEATRTVPPRLYESLHDLILAYLEHLRGRPCYGTKVYTASQWILTLSHTPTRKEMLARHLAKGHGHFQPGSAQANMELGLLRAACRWGLYQECWNGGDPTAGIKKWKRAKRTRTGKFEELTKLLVHFDEAVTDYDIRDRALLGLMLFTGCRQKEARATKLDAITPYGQMGAWDKGTTKTGEKQELPLPKQLMPWLAAWKAIRSTERPNPYLFPSRECAEPIGDELARYRWNEVRKELRITGLWSYDLRRTLATSMSNELKYDDSTIRAILNHHDTSALSHYRFKSFDSLTKPIQDYADWLWKLKQTPKEGALAPVLKPKPQAVPIPVIPAPTPWPHAPQSAIQELIVAPAFTLNVPGLTRREREMLACYAKGTRSPQLIAAQLGISAKTVQGYRERLMGKLNMESTPALIRYAAEHVTVPAPTPVMAPAVVRPSIPASMPIVPVSRMMEREEWPG